MVEKNSNAATVTPSDPCIQPSAGDCKSEDGFRFLKTKFKKTFEPFISTVKGNGNATHGGAHLSFQESGG